MLSKVKNALRVASGAFDAELNDLIEAALLDLGIAGVDSVSESDALVIRAVITYCKMHFGASAVSDKYAYDRLKKSYDEQKAQLAMSSNYVM